MLDPDLPLLEPGADQHERPCGLWHDAEPLGVGDRLNLVQQLHVREVVHEHRLLQDHHNPVPPQPHRPHLGPEREVAYAPRLVVVPDHDLGGRVVRGRPATDEGEDVAAEEHLRHSDAAARTEVAAEDLAERLAVVDAEAVAGAGGEAGVVLVEGQVEELGRRGGRGGRRGGGIGRGGGGVGDRVPAVGVVVVGDQREGIYGLGEIGGVGLGDEVVGIGRRPRVIRPLRGGDGGESGHGGGGDGDGDGDGGDDDGGGGGLSL